MEQQVKIEEIKLKVPNMILHIFGTGRGILYRMEIDGRIISEKEEIPDSKVQP